VLNDLIVS
jgi:glyoxylate carboligase